MSHLSLKIVVVSLGLTKTIQFSGDLSVHEVCKEIREKFGEGAGGSDHGLLWPDQRKWLQPNKLLDFYDLNSSDTLEFRKKHRALKVKTMDDSVKTILIDESLPVQQLVELICERIGLQNPEEYSILPENPHPEMTHARESGKESSKQAAPATKGKGGKEVLAGDQTKWLHPEKTLREQGLTEDDTVILKKKFFFTDQNIDRNDPVQLNLLYNQAREMIISGKHPCTADEACQFGAIQMQVQYGNHDPDKHKMGFIKLKDYVPPEYQKTKDVEKRIYTEHGKLQGLTELNAKFRYVQLSRSLKTYGITFFLVQDETAKKKKDMLLGVTKQSVVKLDPITKEVIKEWRLIQLRRWAASPNSFTMDFGDYADAYFSVKTTEGEQISQLIAGYIDIIIKKRKEAEKVVEIEEEEQATVEDYVAPSRATNVGIVGGGSRTAVETKLGGSGMVSDGMRPGWGQAGRSVYSAQYGAGGGFTQHMSEITGAQQTLLQSLSNGFAMVNNAAADMKVPANLPPLGNDAAAMQWKQHTVDVNAEAVSTQIASNLAAAGSLINNATGYVEEMDYEMIGTSIATMTANLGQMAQGIKLLAGLQESVDDQQRLLEAGRNIANATARLLDAAQPICMGQTNREDFFNSARSVASESAALLMLMGRLDVDENAQLDLIESAKAVAKAVSDLKNHARAIAVAIKDPTAQQVVVHDAKRVDEAAPTIIACTGTVCPAITNSQCFDQLVESAMLMRDGMEQLVGSSHAAGNAKLENMLKESVQKVEEAIARLIEKAKKGGDASVDDPLDRQYDSVISSIDQMFDNLGSVEGIVNGARDLTMISMQYVNMLKGLGLDVADEDEKHRLLNAARALGDATSKMVAAAKDAARNPNDATFQARLEDTILDVRAAANTAAGPELRAKAFHRLAKAVKDAIASSNQLISASRTIAQSNRNQTSQIQLNQAAKRVTEITPSLSSAMKTSITEPDNLVAQIKLVEAAKKFVTPGNALVASAKTAAPTTADIPAQSALLAAVKQTDEDLRKLEKAFALAEEAGAGLELESALYSLQAYHQELKAASANPSALVPLEGYGVELSQMELLGAVKSLQSTITQLVGGVQQQNEKVAGTAATDAVAALQALSFAALALAAAENDFDLRRDLLGAANGVAFALSDLVNVTKDAVDDQAGQKDFEKMTSQMTLAIEGLIKFLPGQKELEQAMSRIRTALAAMEKRGVSSLANSSESFQAAQTKLQTAATSLGVAANGLVSASRGSPTELHQTVTAFTTAFNKLGEASGIYAAATQDKAVAGRLLQLLNDVGGSCEKMLGFMKTSITDPSNVMLRSQLMNATKGVGDAINQLLEVCSASAPGHVECNNALQTLNIASAKLGTVNDGSMNQDPYAESVARASAASKMLASTLNNLSTNARSANALKMAGDTVELANAILSVTEAAVRAAYLVGSADASSIPAILPVIDQQAFSQAGLDIKDACKKLIDRGNTQQQILDMASLIAKHTATLCTSCKDAGTNAAVTPLAKQHFITSAKDLAAKTTNLVASIKQLAIVPSEDARAMCQETSQHLTDAVDHLVAFAVSSEFAGTEAKIGSAAAAAQRPILDGTQSLISAAQDLVGTVKLLCGTPKDQSLHQLLQGQSRAAIDAIQSNLQTVSCSAPGQRECESALQQLSESIATVDGAIMEATVNNLAPQQSAASAATIVDNVRAIASLCDVVAKAAKDDAAALGASVTELPGAFARAATAAVALASNAPDMQQQMNILEQVKALGDAMNAFVLAAKTNGGNARNTQGIAKIDEQRTKFRTAVSKVVTTLEGSRDDSGEFTKAVEQIESIVASLESKVPVQVQKAYHLFEEDVDAAGKQIITTVGDTISKAKTPDQFRKTAAQIATLYEDICTKGGCAVRATNDEKVQTGLLDNLRGLGAASIKLIEAIRHASGKSAADSASRTKLSQAAREVSTAVANLMTVTKEGSKGLLQCKTAVTNINDIISDLEGTLIFAQAGQLDPVDAKDHFARHKDGLLAAARTVTEGIKAFITGVTGTQDELGAISTASVTALNALKNQVRSGAIAITSADKHMQQQLLGAAKAVAEGLQSLISTATNACGKPSDDPVMVEFAGKVKAEFQAIGELIRATKVLGDEASRGIRAMQGAIAEINETLAVLESAEPAQGSALPDEVAGSAKLLATAAASLVSASSGKQDELVAAANALKKQMQDLVRAAKAATEKAPDEQKAMMIDAVKKAGEAVKGLLSRIKTSQENSDPQNKTNVQAGAKEVALSVNAIVNAAGALLPAGYVDPNDPNVIAERELLAAAASIEAAARKLANLAPAERPRTANEDLNFEEQILEAAKAIAAATAALVRSATGAQREIVAKGRSGPKEEAMYFSDGTWSDGLVSAAKMVAAATGDLCEAANQAVKGKVERERVIVAAKAVSASTAQLLAAATARADPNSQAQIRLRAAGKAVTTSTDSLVKAAEENMRFDDADQFSSLLSAANGVGGAMKARVAEMEAQVAILKMEKELERARQKLASVRKGKYEAAATKKESPGAQAGKQDSGLRGTGLSQ